MGINKNFVVKNGIEVNENLIYADPDTDRVGIVTTTPDYTLEVNGGIGATTLTIVGFSTLNDLEIDGKISAGNSFGSPGQYLISTGTGVTWTSVPTVKSTDIQTAGVGATTFNTTYTVGLLDVYVNGVKLSASEYTAADSATVVFESACFGGETIEFVSFSPFGIGLGGTSIQGITILEEGFSVGNPLEVTSINFVGASVTAVGSGIGVTVYFSDYVNSSGISSYSDVAGIATYASYSDVAGITTYSTNSGISSYSDFSGISTYSTTSGISSYSDVAGISSYAETAGVSTNAIGGIVDVISVNSSGIVTAIGGFTSIANTTPVTIELVGNQLTFEAIGVGSTTFTLF